MPTPPRGREPRLQPATLRQPVGPRYVPVQPAILGAPAPVPLVPQMGTDVARDLASQLAGRGTGLPANLPSTGGVGRLPYTSQFPARMATGLPASIAGQLPPNSALAVSGAYTPPPPGFRTLAPINTAAAVDDLYGAARFQGARDATSRVGRAASGAATGARSLPSAARGAVAGGLPGIASRSGYPSVGAMGRAVGGRALLGGGLAMGFDALRGGENTAIDQAVEGALLGGTIGSAIPVVGTGVGAVAGAGLNLLRNALTGGGGGGQQAGPADQFAATVGALTPELQSIFQNRFTQLRAQGMDEDEAYTTLTGYAQQIVDQQFAQDIANAQADQTGQMSAQDMMQLQLLAGNIMEPIAQRTAANADLTGAMYQQLASAQGMTPQMSAAVNTMANATRLGGQQLADAYRAQAQLQPQMQQLNANIAASYQQPAATSSLDLSAFGL